MTRRHQLHALAWLPVTAAGCVVVLAVMVLLGWQINNEFLYGVIHGLPPMVPNTALGFFFSGLSLWLLSGEEHNILWNYVGQLFAVGALLIGVLTIVEYLNSTPLLSIDRLLLPLFSHEPFVLRPSPHTAIAFSFAGMALLLLGTRNTLLVDLVQWLSLLVLMIAVVVFFGYIYGELSFYSYTEVIGMALHTAVGFILLALGLLLAKPEVGLMRAISAKTTGGMMMRRLLPAIVLVPLIFGWLVMLGRYTGLYTEQFGTALLQSLSVIVMAFIIAYVAGIVNREEKLKLDAEQLSRQHEAELAHMDRLNTMGEMASGIVHEVTQPLTTISVYAVAIKRILDDMKSVPPDVLLSLERIGSEVGLATEIIQRMRAYTSKQSPQKSRVAMQDLISEVVKFIEDAAHKHAVQLHVSLDEELPLIEVDAIQIEQVLLNIVRNAIEAMQTGQVSEKFVTIRAYVNKFKELQVDIRDTGPGMDAATLSHVFESFFSTKGAEGMGMGLSISQSIIEAHGGRIWAESTPGKGTTFSFTLAL